MVSIEEEFVQKQVEKLLGKELYTQFREEGKRRARIERARTEATYIHTPAECEYYVLCECQYGTQSCSMIREDCLKCTRRQSYIDEKAGTDIETGRIDMYTKEGQKDLYRGY